MRLYHGSAHGLGLEVGDLILPSGQTGAESLAKFATADGDREYLSKPHLVYLTSDERIAAMFAAMRATRDSKGVGGDVYEVEPLGAVEPDPDYHPPQGEPHTSWQTTSARVLRVVRRRIPIRHGLHTVGLTREPLALTRAERRRMGMRMHWVGRGGRL